MHIEHPAKKHHLRIVVGRKTAHMLYLYLDAIHRILSSVFKSQITSDLKLFV